jgi:hypothetical protein
MVHGFVFVGPCHLGIHVRVQDRGLGLVHWYLIADVVTKLTQYYIGTCGAHVALFYS